MNLRGVHDDDVVTDVEMRDERRLVLSPQD
jgi:hypothetical protein